MINLNFKEVFQLNLKYAPSSQSAWMFYIFSPNKTEGFWHTCLACMFGNILPVEASKKKRPKNQDFREILGMGQIRWPIDILCFGVFRIFPLMIDWPSLSNAGLKGSWWFLGGGALRFSDFGEFPIQKGSYKVGHFFHHQASESYGNQGNPAFFTHKSQGWMDMFRFISSFNKW